MCIHWFVFVWCAFLSPPLSMILFPFSLVYVLKTTDLRVDRPRSANQWPTARARLHCPEGPPKNCVQACCNSHETAKKEKTTNMNEANTAMSVLKRISLQWESLFMFSTRCSTWPLVSSLLPELSISTSAQEILQDNGIWASILLTASSLLSLSRAISRLNCWLSVLCVKNPLGFNYYHVN